jgi:uncharacterized membrane protein YoaK (UPF0700 family)
MDRTRRTMKNYIGAGLAVGVALGVALGTAFHNLALWIGVGLALGVGWDSVMSRNRNKGTDDGK